MRNINFVKDMKAREVLEKIDVMVLVDEAECKIRENEDNITDIMVDLSLEYEIVVSIYTQSVEEYEKQAKVLPFLINLQKEGINVHG
jgi:hypothetical protein